MSATGLIRIDRWRWLFAGGVTLPRLPLAGGAIALASLAAAGLLAGPGATLTTVWVQDVLGFAEGAHRIASGQVPHVDFATPLGGLFYLIPYVGLLLGGSYAAAMPTGVAAVLLASTPILIYVLTTRLRPWLAVPVGMVLILLVAAPMLDGDLPSRITHAMWYNRLCWIWLSLLAMLYLPAAEARGVAAAADGLVAGALVALMLYTKVTYAVCGFAFLGLWFVLRRDARRPVLLALALVAGVAAGVELAWGLHRGYVDDVLLATRSGPAMIGGPLQLVRTAIKSVGEITIAALALGFAAYAGALRWRDGVFALFVLGASLFILNQNSGGGHLVPLLVVVALAVEQTARRLAGWRGAPPLALLACVALAVVLVAEKTVYRAAALAWHYKATADQVPPPGTPEALAGFLVQDYKGYRVAPFPGPGLTAMERTALGWREAVELLRGSLPPPETGLLTGAEILFTLGKGIEALAGLEIGDRAVFTYDIYNPLAFILGAMPPRGGMAIYHFGRWYNETTLPAAERVLADVELVLVPKFPIGDALQQTLWRAHRDYVASHYVVVRETPYWTVWRHREAAYHADTATAINGPF